MDRQQLSSWEHHNKDPPAAVAAGLYEACSGAVVLAMGEPDLDVGSFQPRSLESVTRTALRLRGSASVRDPCPWGRARLLLGARGTE